MDRCLTLLALLIHTLQNDVKNWHSSTSVNFHCDTAALMTISIWFVSCLPLSAQNGLEVLPIASCSSSISPGSFCSSFIAVTFFVLCPLSRFAPIGFYLPGYNLWNFFSYVDLQTGAMWPNLPQLWHSASQNQRFLASLFGRPQR